MIHHFSHNGCSGGRGAVDKPAQACQPHPDHLNTYTYHLISLLLLMV